MEAVGLDWGRPHIQLTKAGCFTFGGAACGELPGWRSVCDHDGCAIWMPRLSGQSLC